jgi:hypothetical protein
MPFSRFWGRITVVMDVPPSACLICAGGFQFMQEVDPDCRLDLWAKKAVLRKSP